MPKYDVVIFGAGAAGCAVAALLAKAGKRVMLTDPASAAGGGAAAVDVQGHRVSGWPLYSYGFEEGGAWTTVLQRLDFQTFASQQGASYQVALPGRRVTVTADREANLEELRREYPAEIDALRRFYRDCGVLGARMRRSRLSAYLAHRKRAGNFLGAYRFSRELLAFFSASSFLFFGRFIEDISLSQLIVLVSAPPRRIPGGFDGLARDLCEFLSRQGGECRFGEPWPEILVRRSRLAGLQTAGGRIDLRAAVLNVPLRVRERTFFALVQEEVVPVGMHDTVLVVQDYDRPAETVVLSLDALNEAGKGFAGRRVLKAFFPHPSAHEASPAELIGRISSIIPFLADFTEATVLRDQTERLVPMPVRDTGTNSLSIRGAYALDDTPFGVARQASDALALAAKLA